MNLSGERKPFEKINPDVPPRNLIITPLNNIVFKNEAMVSGE